MKIWSIILTGLDLVMLKVEPRFKLNIVFRYPTVLKMLQPLMVQLR